MQETRNCKCLVELGMSTRVHNLNNCGTSGQKVVLYKFLDMLVQIFEFVEQFLRVFYKVLKSAIKTHSGHQKTQNFMQISNFLHAVIKVETSIFMA